MRLGIPLGTGKLILQISPGIALVPGLGAHQMHVLGHVLALAFLDYIQGRVYLDDAFLPSGLALCAG